jgi:hypothetical protein
METIDSPTRSIASLCEAACNYEPKYAAMDFICEGVDLSNISGVQDGDANA